MKRKKIACCVFFLFTLFPILLFADSGNSINLFANAQRYFSEDNSYSSSDDNESKLQIHGYLTQAYARTTDYQIFGIPDSGTADYRTAALQFRYSITSKDTFAIQFSHERLGRSHANDVKNDIELDWAFYEHNFNDSTSIKIGKVQIPLGFYNEIRDVGTLLPFYRPPITVYQEAAYASETLNGFVFSNTFFPESDWNIDTDLYYGDWTSIRMHGELYFKEPVENMAGINLWLNTPYHGIRIGASGSRYSASPLGAPPNTDPVSWKIFTLSGEASYSHFIFRSEYAHASENNDKYNGYYVHIGYKATNKVTINFQAEIGKVNLQVPIIGIFKIDWTKDVALGINYYFTPQLVAKFEGHWNKGYSYDNLPLEYILFAKALKSKYFIISLAVSF